MTDAFLERRRTAAAAAWNLDGGVVLVAAGDEIPVPGRGDRTYPFRAHAEYQLAPLSSAASSKASASPESRRG
jgi:hypothetical protein